MSKTKQVLVEAPWETEFGTIKPGDAVAYVTVSTQHLHLSQGVYLGYYTRTDRWGEHKNVRLEVEKETSEWYWDDGRKFKWSEYTNEFNAHVKSGKIVMTNRKFRGTTTLQRNRIIPLPPLGDSVLSLVNGR